MTSRLDFTSPPYLYLSNVSPVLLGEGNAGWSERVLGLDGKRGPHVDQEVLYRQRSRQLGHLVTILILVLVGRITHNQYYNSNLS